MERVARAHIATSLLPLLRQAPAPLAISDALLSTAATARCVIVATLAANVEASDYRALMARADCAQFIVQLDESNALSAARWSLEHVPRAAAVDVVCALAARRHSPLWHALVAPMLLTHIAARSSEIASMFDVNNIVGDDVDDNDDDSDAKLASNLLALCKRVVVDERCLFFCSLFLCCSCRVRVLMQN